MKRLHWLFTLTSLTVILVTIERFSFTTKIILQPYSFLRLHEVFQISVLILATVVIPFFLLRELSHNFEFLKTKKGIWLGVMFIIGVYFYATGNGVHELGSYLFNTFCDTKYYRSVVCGSMFFNDYYFGNILYFIGAYLIYVSLILFELMKPAIKYTKKDFILITLNSLVFALTIFAYAGFDRVLVGLVYSLITMGTIDALFLLSRKKYTIIPFTTYCVVAYTLGTVASLLVRFR